MKYIKKVSVSEIPENSGAVIDSMNPGDDQTVNAPSIHAVKEYVGALESGIQYPSYTNGSDISSSRKSYYFKSGNVGCVAINVKNVTVSSGGYLTLFTLPTGYRPTSDVFSAGCKLGYSTILQIMVNSSGSVQISYTGDAISSNHQICGNITFYIE